MRELEIMELNMLNKLKNRFILFQFQSVLLCYILEE